MTVRGGHIQRTGRAEHGRPQPTVHMVEFRHDNLTHQGAIISELKDTQRLVLERSHGQSPLPLAPAIPIQKYAAAGSPGRIPR